MTFKFKVPHTLVLLFAMIVLAQISSYLIPKGVYDMKDQHGHEVVIPGTYHRVEGVEQLKAWHLFMAIPRAFADAQGIRRS